MDSDDEYPDEWLIDREVGVGAVKSWAAGAPQRRYWSEDDKLMVAAAGYPEDGWRIIFIEVDEGWADWEFNSLPGVKEVKSVTLVGDVARLDVVLDAAEAAKLQVDERLVVELPNYGRGLSLYDLNKDLASLLAYAGNLNVTVESKPEVAESEGDGGFQEANARIVFFGSPWPNGHPAALDVELSVEEDEAWLSVCLYSADYGLEGPGARGSSEWASPMLWLNFHRAKLEGTFSVQGVRNVSDLHGTEFRVDHDKLKTGSWTFDELAFDECYVLGHDAVAGHRFKFTVHGETLHVDWRGKLARAYQADCEFRYDFSVQGEVRLRTPTT